MKISHFRWILLIFWLILAGLIVWFKVVPSGQMTYLIDYPAKINLLGGKGFIGLLTPADRVKIEAGQSALITGDPVYFSVFTPRTFSEAKLTITYQDNLTTSTPVIDAGVLVDNIIWRYQLAPLQNKLLDNGFAGWSKIQSGNILLLQKDNKFSSIEEFLVSLKNNSQNICYDKNIRECLALYNFDNINDYFSDNYDLENINNFEPIKIPLKGAHQFYFKSIANQDLKFDFDFTDLNLDKKSDPIVISIYKGEKKVYSTTVEDYSGNEGSGVVKNSFVPISYQAISSSTALYKLEIKASDDIVIKRISRAPSALNVISRLYPVNVSALPISVWTDSSFIKLTTNNPGSRQTISFDNQQFLLSEPYQQFEFFSNKNGAKEIKLTKDDVILETDGVFSFAANNFFNPEFKKIDKHFIPTKDIQYILAEYNSPVAVANNFKQATVILDTKEAYREKGKYSFMISVPGLSLANVGNLKISSIKIEFSGRTIWDKIKEYVN